MNRRRILASTGVSIVTLVSGCLGDVSRVVEQADSFSRHVTVEKVTEPETASVSVEVLQQITAQTPGEIRISFTNTTSKERTYRFGTSPPFTAYEGSHQGTKSTLLSVPGIIKRSGGELYLTVDSFIDRGQESALGMRLRSRDGCWWTVDEHIKIDERRDVVLSPGESVSKKYKLFVSADGPPCMRGGNYRFRTDEGTLAERTYSTTRRTSRETWGFTLRIEP